MGMMVTAMTNRQSRKASAIESAVNILVGCGISWSLTVTVMPLFGHDVSGGQAAWITAIFTVASFARSYCLRRIYERVWR